MKEKLFTVSRKILLLLLALSAMSFAHAQRQVSGVVTSADDGATLPGVAVQVKGTTTGTITDYEGKYSLSAPEGSTLVFSFVGMETQEVPVGTSNTIDVVMQTASEDIEEVLVIGYGTKKKRDYIGSIASVSSDELTAAPSSSFTSALQGKAAGVHIQSTSGVPGSQVNIKVRGLSSLTLNTSPLWIIDGMPVYSGGGLEATVGSTSQDPMSMINMNDIESIEVLKDAAATSIYGSRGSNGVIIVTTKSGKKGTGGLNVDYSTGITNLSRTPEQVGFTNTTEWFSLVDQARENSDLAPFDPFDIIRFFRDDPLATLSREEAMLINTDWFDEILQTGSYQDINVSASKAFDKGSYFLSASYNDTKSNLKNNYFKRFSARVNVDFEPVENLNIGARFGLSYTQNTRVQQQVGGATGNNSGGANAGFGNANRVALPWFPIYNDYHPTGYWNPMSGANLIASVDNDNHLDQVDQYRGIGTIFLEYKLPFIEGLSIRSEGSFDMIQNNSVYWVSEYLREEGSYARDRAVTRQSLNYNVYGKYNRTFNENHSVSATFGIEGQSQHQYRRDMEAQRLNGSYQQIGTPDDYMSMYAGLGGEEYLLGMIGRADYKFKDRYIIGTSLRRDASSKFAEEFRWQTFASFSAGWIITEEAFMSGLPFLNFLKLRGSFGQTGNKDIPSSRFVTTYSNNAGDRYGEQNLISGGSHITNLGTPNLTWETTNSYDVGIDFGFLDNRVSGSFAYYQQDISDLLLYSSLPPSAGVGGLWSNVGDMRNSGFEFSINSVNIHKPKNKFKWTTDLNFTTNQNKALSLTPRYDSQGIGINSGRTKTVTGGLLWTFYTCEWAGVDPERGVDMIYEIDYDLWERTGETVKTGRIIPATTTNLARNRIIHEDKTSVPKFYGGITNTITYKGFDFMFLVTFSGGDYFYDYEEQRTTSVQYGQVVLREDLIGNTWTQPGDDAHYPQLVWDSRYDYGWDHEIPNPEWTGDPDDPRATGYWTESGVYNNEGGVYDKYLYKGDYIRLKTIQLGYTFPETVAKRIKMKNLRLYIKAENVLTITAYEGWDPETGGGVMPPLRVISFGANVKL